jgi:hypothetical protein
VPDESPHARTPRRIGRRLASGMTDSASAHMPVAIDRVDCTRSDRDGIELRVTGRWLAAEQGGAAEPLLVVQVSGRRHRFAPARESFTPPPGVLEATFRIPPWAQPRHEGQAALWVGTSVVPVPLPGGSPDGIHRLPPPPALGEARAWPPDVASPPPEVDPILPSDAPDLAVDTGRTGPLAELLFKESMSALHAELEERSAEMARLQGALADAKSDLEARGARQAALESAHTDLRGELQELISAVSTQRDEHERRLSEAEERVAEAQQRAVEAEAERDRLRAELDAQRREADRALEVERHRFQTDVEAQRQDAADLRHRLASAASGRQQHDAELSVLRDHLTSAQVSRDAAAGEVAGLRVELERLASELAITREHQSAKGADLGEAQRLLAEARSLSEQLRSQSSQ